MSTKRPNPHPDPVELLRDGLEYLELADELTREVLAGSGTLSIEREGKPVEVRGGDAARWYIDHMRLYALGQLLASLAAGQLGADVTIEGPPLPASEEWLKYQLLEWWQGMLGETVDAVSGGHYFTGQVSWVGEPEWDPSVMTVELAIGERRRHCPISEIRARAHTP